MNARTNRAARRLLVSLCAVLCGAWMVPVSAEDVVPKHLQVARDIVKSVKPENNVYSNARTQVRFPGDLFTSEYSVHTNCIGLVDASFEKATGKSLNWGTRKYRNQYSIIDWVDGVERGENFDKVAKIPDLQPGDMIMWKYLIYPAYNPEQVNGHILMVDSKPVKVEPQRKPIMEGMTQWEIWIIDSGMTPMSADDTRFVKVDKVPEGMKWEQTQRNGAGRGRFYIYSNEKGEIVGTAAAFQKAKVQVNGVDRHIIMARVRPN